MLEQKPLIDGYLDETLTLDEHRDFYHWLMESPLNRQRFAETVMLHDRMRAEFLAMSTINSVTCLTPPVQSIPRRGLQSATAILGATGALALIIVAIWKGFGETPAAAAVIELNRLIVTGAHATDRTYHIDVQEIASPNDQRNGLKPADSGRPPKPPLDDAKLYVREGRRFVLIRNNFDGRPFITGSDGLTSWAVRPDGPVRVSSDLTQFNRDLPGHECDMPLINIEEGLERLREVYDLRLLPSESGDIEHLPDDEPLRLIVAVKRRGFRGPRRVEIWYAVSTGKIRAIRFVDMPYGPDRLTLQLKLVNERALPANFFDHTSHHSADRVVEFEDTAAKASGSKKKSQ